MTRRHVISGKLQRKLKYKKITLKDAQKMIKENGIEVSLGWLSTHKDVWQPDKEQIMAGKFKEYDKTLDTDLASRIMLLRGKQIKEMSDQTHFSKNELVLFCSRTVEACTEFAKKCLVFAGKPIILQYHQKQMISGWLGEKNTVYAIGRGGGKDFTLAIFLAWYCTAFPNTRIAIVCPAYRQVKTFIHENLALMCQTSSVLYDSVARFTDEEFFFTNGSQVFTYGATSYIKGKHNLHFIFANEAAEISEHVFINVLLPMLGIGEESGHFGIMGVPGGQQGYFWKAFQDSSISAHDQDYAFMKLHLPTSVNKYYSKKQLKENKRIMSHDAWLQEHEARFLDVADALFSSAILDKCKEEYDMTFGIVRKDADYYMGIDWGRSAASSVFTILEKVHGQEETRIVYIKQTQDPFSLQHVWLLETHAMYNFKRIATEYMGLGMPPSERLREEIGSEIVKFFTPSTASWFTVFTNLRDACDQQKMVIPSGALKLLSQLRLMQFKVRGEKLTVRSEGKDDWSQSFAIAFHAIAKASGAGVAGRLLPEEMVTKKPNKREIDKIFIRKREGISLLDI